LDRKRLAVRATDMERVLDQFESPVLGSHFRATLPTGRIVKLLVSLQGQDVISMPALESIAYKEAHITPFELHGTYLPLFQDWGFVRIYENRIEENIKSRQSILERAGRLWEESNPHPVEQLGIELFDKAALSPLPSDTINKTLSRFDELTCKSSLTHLRESGLVDQFQYKETEWFYSPEIFGENYSKTIKFIANQSQDERKRIYSVIESVLQDQGVPHSTLAQKSEENLINQIVGAGLLMGYPLSIGDSTHVYYFTPDLRNRYDREGRGDKFELIKTGISHFQFAYRLADARTGKLRFSPYIFLDKLLEKGTAGNATAIGTDYYLLVQKGLVKIERTYGTRYRFLLPDSEEKIADLETIRDSFKDKWIVPRIDLSVMGIPAGAIPGDSIVYRSRKVMQAKELAREFASEVFKL